DILFINEEEIKMLINESNIYQAAEIALSFGPKIVVIKCGEHGSVCIGENFIFFAPAYPVKKVIDPTGAGDSFAGGFMGYLTRKDNFDKDTIRNAMIYGTIMASFCVESFSLDRVKEVTSEMIESRKEEIRESVIF
ncbi:MAG: sugar kinase, partial [Candidatus Cloacimonetes bacterium]|nr:sugar kinase [Candidatus Cloacimonadota bacterium]